MAPLPILPSRTDFWKNLLRLATPKLKQMLPRTWHLAWNRSHPTRMVIFLLSLTNQMSLLRSSTTISQPNQVTQ